MEQKQEIVIKNLEKSFFKEEAERIINTKKFQLKNS